MRALFEVQTERCPTCIYGKSDLDLGLLLDQIRDPSMAGHFKSWRVCHHSDSACCRGFWDAHRNDFNVGQLAQRLGLVTFVDHDTLKGLGD